MSQKASGYERIEGDAYFTPHWVTEALLSVEKFPYGGVWDPAAGAGHILDPFKAAGHTVWGTDINPAAAGILLGDFFDQRLGESMISAIATNPPYGVRGRLAVKFIERAVDLMRGAPGGVGKVAMLLRVDFDSADGRRHIFNDHPAFAAKYTLTYGTGRSAATEDIVKALGFMLGSACGQPASPASTTPCQFSTCTQSLTVLTASGAYGSNSAVAAVSAGFKPAARQRRATSPLKPKFEFDILTRSKND